jgi:hypothetical protein
MAVGSRLTSWADMGFQSKVSPTEGIETTLYEILALEWFRILQGGKKNPWRLHIGTFWVSHFISNSKSLKLSWEVAF